MTKIERSRECNKTLLTRLRYDLRIYNYDARKRLIPGNEIFWYRRRLCLFWIIKLHLSRVLFYSMMKIKSCASKTVLELLAQKELFLRPAFMFNISSNAKKNWNSSRSCLEMDWTWFDFWYTLYFNLSIKTDLRIGRYRRPVTISLNGVHTTPQFWIKVYK